MTDISRKRGDTYADERVIIDKETGLAIDITGWTFLLTVDPSDVPTDALNNVMQISGVITDAAAGVVEFAPSALQADSTPGAYWFDIEYTDVLSRKRTIETGRYVIKQDITK